MLIFFFSYQFYPFQSSSFLFVSNVLVFIRCFLASELYNIKSLEQGSWKVHIKSDNECKIFLAQTDLLIGTLSTFGTLCLASTFVRSAWSFVFYHPRHNGQWPLTSKDFLSQILPLHLFSYPNSWDRASIFPFECSVLNKGTTDTTFITSLVWRGPWLGIEPETSRTRSQHSTTRLSRRRYFPLVSHMSGLYLYLICGK